MQIKKSTYIMDRRGIVIVGRKVEIITGEEEGATSGLVKRQRSRSLSVWIQHVWHYAHAFTDNRSKERADIDMLYYYRIHFLQCILDNDIKPNTWMPASRKTPLIIFTISEKHFFQKSGLWLHKYFILPTGRKYQSSKSQLHCARKKHKRASQSGRKMSFHFQQLEQALKKEATSCIKHWKPQVEADTSVRGAEKIIFHCYDDVTFLRALGNALH